MASLTLRGLKTAGKLKPIFSLRSFSTTRVVNGTKPWYYLYEPGPYPESLKEEEIAAKKYGMIPFDYKPLPKNTEDDNYGDYPDLPLLTDSDRYYENFDMPGLKRNYGEPVHVSQELFTPDRYDPLPELSVFPKWKYWAGFLGVFTVWSFIFYFFPQWININPSPLMPKQYPFEQIALNYPENNYPGGRKVYKCVDKSKHYVI